MSTVTHAGRFLWMQAVLADPELTDAQKIVLIRLSLYLNVKNGRCDPSVRALAVGAGVSERTVQTALARGQTLGWISRRIGGGRGNTNGYGLLETTRGAAPFSQQTVSFDASKGENGRTKSCTVPHPNMKKNIEENMEGGRRKNYAWEGQVIRLVPAHFQKWKHAYRDIPDLEAALQRADDWYAEHPPEDGKWFYRVSRWLAKDNAEHAQRRKAAEQARDSW